MSRDPGLEARPEAEIVAEIRRLELELSPLQQRAQSLRADIELLRTELRRRQRSLEVAHRREVRTGLRQGSVPTLEEAVSSTVEMFPTASSLDQLRFLRESATEVRLGYAAASNQSMEFTDGRQAAEARDLARAHELWRQGWEFGTPLARGVRIYPVGSRAERVVPASEIRVESR